MKLLVIKNLNWMVVILFERTELREEVALFFITKNYIPFLVLDSNRDIEGIWCEEGSSANMLRLAAYCRPPNESEQYTERLCKKLIKKTSGKTVIVHDFNLFLH